MTDYEEGLMLDFIDHRYTECLPTIVTTNLWSRDAMSEAIGERIVDRLFDRCVAVWMRGESMRGWSRAD